MPYSSPIANRRSCIAALFGICLGARHGQAAEQAGDVESARGECYALAAAARRSLQTASTLFMGDTVVTQAQSALGMRLGAATRILLGAEAQLRIDRFLIDAGGTLVLDHGALLYDHADGAGADESTIRSPFGLIAVRGTRFFAGPSNGVFGVFVQRGAVTVVGGNAAVLVTTGFGTNVARPGAHPTTPAPWGAQRIANALASVQ